MGLRMPITDDGQEGHAELDECKAQGQARHISIYNPLHEHCLLARS